MSETDAVTIVTGGVAWGGWEEISISRGVEFVPSSFSCLGTERYPGQTGATSVDIATGTPLVVMIGADPVITGYADAVDRTVTPREHTVHVQGRSKLSDLCDCSGFTEAWQLQNLTMVAIAKAVCAPYGIDVSAPDGDTAPIPSITIALTQTGWELLEDAGRWMNKLVYDDVNGNLVIADLGDKTHTSGVVEGSNVQEMSSALNLSEVYTEIRAIYSDIALLSDGADTTDVPWVTAPQATNGTLPKRADGQPRYRPLLIVSEQGPGYAQVVQRRVAWEMARRVGRGQVVTVTVDSWRDSGGNLWTPNWLIPIDLPSIKFPKTTLLVTQVTYLRDEQGTRAELVLMPPAAMAPMPTAPYQYDPTLIPQDGSTATGAQAPATTGQ